MSTKFKPPAPVKKRSSTSRKGCTPDLVLLDLLMPGIDGLQTLEQLRHLQPGLKVVMLSCVNDTRKVVQAMRLGAIDYLTKPFQKAELDAVIGQCVGTAKGESYAGDIEELCDDVFFVAASPGDEEDPLAGGTGRQRRHPGSAARRERHGQGSAGPPDPQTFAAGAPHLPQSKLRGGAGRPAGKRTVRIRSGSVYGRQSRQARQVRTCATRAPSCSTKSARCRRSCRRSCCTFFRTRQFSRLGSRTMVKVDVRILAATNIDIPEALANKRLREDLYYRLNAFTMSLPPLRDRKEEIPILLKHFMSRMSESYARPPLPLSGR
jgi:two-component system response regulator AtoC